MKFKGISEEHMLYGTLFSLANRIQTIGDNQFKEVTMKQHFLLIGLELFEEPPTLRELSDVVGCSYQNVKRMLVALEKNGYVKLVQDDADRRKQRVVSMGRFHELEQESSDMAKKFMKQLYNGISKEEMSSALKVLVKMENNIGGYILNDEKERK